MDSHQSFILLILHLMLFKSPSLLVLAHKHRNNKSVSSFSPAQPRGFFESDSNRCETSEGVFFRCPEHTEWDNSIMDMFMNECRYQEEESKHAANLFDYTCVFFPMQKNEHGQLTSCHNLKHISEPCMYGFKVETTHQKRKFKESDSGYISIEFYGKIPPLPKRDQNGNIVGGYVKTEYMSFAISEDKNMGEDLVIYCHPFMDGYAFPNLDHDEYPDNIGIAITQNTRSEGKQAYDAKRDWDHTKGSIRNGRVTYYRKTFGSTANTQSSWGILKCEAAISTYFLIGSRAEIRSGLEMDLQAMKQGYIFLATGPCLQEECLGDCANNTEELADIARRTTPMGIHRSYWISDKKILFYQSVEEEGEGVKANKGDRRRMHVIILVIALEMIMIETFKFMSYA